MKDGQVLTFVQLQGWVLVSNPKHLEGYLSPITPPALPQLVLRFHGWRREMGEGRPDRNRIMWRAPRLPALASSRGGPSLHLHKAGTDVPD